MIEAHMSAFSVTSVESARMSLARREQQMRQRERRAHVFVGGGFLIVAVALALRSAGSFSVPIAVVYVAAIALAGRVRFEVGTGFTVPTQAVFVPMLFALPAALVPLLVALGLALGKAVAAPFERASLSRIAAVPANSWFSVGPSVALLASHVHRADARWDILLLALCAQFACDFLANAAWEGMVTDVTIGALAREVRLVYAVDVALSGLGLAVALAALQTHSQLALLLIVPLVGMLSLFSKERQMRLAHLIQLHDAYQGTALLLGDVVEADDTYTGEHCRSVVTLALAVARELGLDPDQQRGVEFGALLHDIGKVAVPKQIINKPGALDAREWAIIRTHTTEGQRMLERIGGFMGEVGQTVRSHHERWDGGGYPDGLSGEAIPLAARIVSACDAFNAMTTDRPYRPATTEAAALEELRRNSGTQFDAVVVEAIVSVVSDPQHNSGQRLPAAPPLR